MKTVVQLSLVLFLVSAVLVSCGVKGPPLPPVPDTPEKSDTDEDLITPMPTPTP